MNVRASSIKTAKAAVVGIGNDFRHDDAAGLHVLRELKSHDVVAGVNYIESDGDLSHLLSICGQYSFVILVDAVCVTNRSASVLRLDAINQNLAEAGINTTSSHSFGLAAAIELARQLKQLPDTLIVYGIPGTDFSVGQGLSQTVRQAVSEAVERILCELASWE